MALSGLSASAALNVLQRVDRRSYDVGSILQEHKCQTGSRQWLGCLKQRRSRGMGLMCTRDVFTLVSRKWLALCVRTARLSTILGASGLGAESQSHTEYLANHGNIVVRCFADSIVVVCAPRWTHIIVYCLPAGAIQPSEPVHGASTIAPLETALALASPHSPIRYSRRCYSPARAGPLVTTKQLGVTAGSCTC
jgi:hypothetical protein